jgi:hypothetical protein
MMSLALLSIVVPVAWSASLAQDDAPLADDDAG